MINTQGDKFWCLKCKANHYYNSKFGIYHAKFATPQRVAEKPVEPPPVHLKKGHKYVVIKEGASVDGHKLQKGEIITYYGTVYSGGSDGIDMDWFEGPNQVFQGTFSPGSWGNAHVKGFLKEK